MLSGPIVRIRPDVLHVNDEAFLDTLYTGSGKRRHKYKVAVTTYATPGSSVGTEHHEVHRIRCAALNPFFSKQSIRRLDPILQETLGKVLDHLTRHASSAEPLKMRLLYSASTSDIIWDYCYGEMRDNLGREDLNEPFFEAAEKANLGVNLGTWINNWMMPLISSSPLWLILMIMPDIEVFVKMMQVSSTESAAVKSNCLQAPCRKLKRYSKGFGVPRTMLTSSPRYSRA